MPLTPQTACLAFIAADIAALEVATTQIVAGLATDDHAIDDPIHDDDPPIEGRAGLDGERGSGAAHGNPTDEQQAKIAVLHRCGEKLRLSV